MRQKLFLIPCGMGDAHNLLLALAGDASLVIGAAHGNPTRSGCGLQPLPDG